jgi:signal transduction histidine kinase
MSVLLLAFGGGWLATQSALRPIRRLAEAAGRIVRTGRTDERVTVGEDDDAIGDLTRVFNAMLDRIEGLVTGMRGALDNVSHDLRTPLTRLRVTAETALAASPDPDRYREALADCVEESDRVLVMLQTLMDISEAESGAMPLQRVGLDLHAVAERAVDLYRDVADAKDVAIDLTGGPAPATGDRVRLEQVAANLLDNAVKYTPAGGRVTVWTGVEHGEQVLRVADTGPGIPADELPRIWERLFRGDRSRTSRGLGLGLSLVKAIVEAHAGRVTVDSTPGQGATFSVYLA